MSNNSLNYSKIGKRIRKLRQSLSYTQEQLAEKTGVSPNHISKIETGNSSISLNVFINLAKTFDVTLDYLMFEKLEKSESSNDIIIKTILSDFSEEQKQFVALFLKLMQSYPNGGNG